MDDRTIGVSTLGKNLDLQAALDYTEKFDNAVGFEVSPDKTQIWSVSNSQDSQMGLKCNPDKSSSPVEARVDSQKLEMCVQRLSRCPGSISTRGRFTAFIKTARIGLLLSFLPALCRLRVNFSMPLPTLRLSGPFLGSTASTLRCGNSGTV